MKRVMHRARAGQSGQSFIEYLVVVTVLMAGLLVGQPSPFEQLFKAFGDAFKGYAYAMSYSTVPNCSQQVVVPDLAVEVTVDVCPDPTNLKSIITLSE
jgi:hypothetical protein